MLQLTNRETQVLTGTIEIIKKYLNPSKIILFGSRAKGSFNENSDFDIAVNEHRPKISIRRKISEELENISGLYSIDIVYLKDLDANFKDLISKQGKLIYERRN
jgi:predicted nucleotidyltransferase